VKRRFAFFTTSKFKMDGVGDTLYRHVYHLWLRPEAWPILAKDGTTHVLLNRISHIIGMIPSKSGRPISVVPKNPRIYQRPSQYYDQVAAMVEREFPALAPHVVRKRANHVIRYKDIEAAGFPPPENLIGHVQVISLRKPFKYNEWYFMKHGVRM